MCVETRSFDEYWFRGTIVSILASGASITYCHVMDIQQVMVGVLDKIQNLMLRGGFSYLEWHQRSHSSALLCFS